MRYHDQHALIVGAGLDGLLAARILVEHFRHVTLISPESSPDPTALPQTIWQALPSHVLAVQGYRVLERLFPGLTAELMVAGAPTVEWTADAVTLLPGGWAPRFHSDLISRPVTQALLMHVVRQRLQEYAGNRVTFRDDCAVGGFQPGQSVSLTVQRGEMSETLTGDLLVDASGRQTLFVNWLNQAGLPLPECTVIPGRVGLSVRLYRRSPNYQPGWQAALVVARNGQPGGALIPVEGGRWLAVCMAPQASQDEAAFLNAARDLPTPILYDAVQRGLPLTPVLSLPETESVRWHFDRLLDWLGTLLVMGTVNVNPACGFDLTASTLAALALKESLEEQRKRYADGRLNGLIRRYNDRMGRAFALPWRWMSAEESQARAGFGTRAARWYGHHVLAAAQTDAAVYQALMSVMGCVAPARTLFTPALLPRVLRGESAALPVESLPPVFEPAYMHKTITQEIASVAGKDQ